MKLIDVLGKPTMRSVFKQDSQIGYSVVEVLVTRFLNSFGFSAKPDMSKIEMITVDTLENFSYETLEDVVLFFKMARSGKLGTTSRGVDSNLIFGEWFPKYLEKKSELREKEYLIKKDEQRSSKTSYKDVMKTYKKNYDKTMPKKVLEHIEHVTKDFDRSMLEELINEWNKDNNKSKWVHLLKQRRRSIKS